MFTPDEGFHCYVEDEDLIYEWDGSAWAIISATALAHALDPASGFHTGTMPESNVVYDDSTGHTHGGSGNDGTLVPDANTTIQGIGTPTYTSIRDALTSSLCAGTSPGSYISDAGGGSVDVAALVGYIRATDSVTGVLWAFDFAGSAGHAITADAIR